MKKIVFTLTVFSLFLISCSNNAKEKPTEQNETLTNEEESHNHDHENDEIVLDNGQKWKVDDSMMLHIRNMEYTVDSFTKVEHKDHDILASRLQTNLDLLTSNCTMTGQAHDELHKWLLPYINSVNELSEAKNEDEASTQFENLQASFITFNQFFK